VPRDSGGGAVLLVPGEHVWIDVVVPRGDPLWDDDVGRSALWLGQIWADAVDDLGVGGAVVQTGPMVRAEQGRHVCFAGLAAGEVAVDGAKLVGISQRRTRIGARFQCLALRAWDIEMLLELLHDATGGPPLKGPASVALRESRVATLDAPVGEIEEAVTSRFIGLG